MKGYKVTNNDYTCRSVKFEVGQTYTVTGAPVMCEHGYHFCEKVADCFNYYSFDPKNKVFEVEATGDVVKGDDKHVTNALLIVRELTWSEMLVLANEGKGNTGLRNTGDWNTGYRNTGYRNTGNRNTGDWNTGNSNTGDSNTGNSNTGYRNTGYRNTGNRNTGDSNTGNSNTGDSNTGNSNTGDRNTGDWNTGDSNTGNRNTGDWNTGDWNTGIANSCNYSSGMFCNEEPQLIMFNKPVTGYTRNDFYNSRAYDLICRVQVTKWIDSSDMTDEEKSANPSHTTTGGYLRKVDYKMAWCEMWATLTDSDKKAFTELPNFDWSVFTDITGINR